MRVKYKIAGVTVLYNPDISVIYNIDSYIQQIDKLFIVDNSDKTNFEVVRIITERYSSDKFEYIKLYENKGIAKALNVGAQKALDCGFDLLFTIDQDSMATVDMVKRLVVHIDKKNVGIVSPFHINKFNSKKPESYGITESFDVMTSGNLFKLSTYKCIGSFNNEYFIDFVDVEYCIRMHEAGYKVYTVNNALLMHNEADITQKKIFGKLVYPANHAAVRLYYKTRNRLDLIKRFKKSYPEFFKYETMIYRNMIIKIILFENNKILKIKYILKGFSDYIRGKFGPISN